MSSVNLGEISKNLYDLLSSLEQEDRQRVITSVLALFGDTAVAQVSIKNNSHALASFNSHGPGTPSSSEIGTAKDYFAQKDPSNRGEMLAVAARYLELTTSKEVMNKNDIEQVFKDSRRNFDGKNFSRDMRNAVHNAKFFLSGGERETYKLSFYGQEYVDALPDKDLARDIKKPGNAKKKTNGKKSDVAGVGE